ncbi:hypothetical protein HDU76_008954 [Blyttiomyces sp. JEL0837]|nr:hypothetical protein HDU76_008954 [Blyttiomyces sp. JEL0837]
MNMQKPPYAQNETIKLRNMVGHMQTTIHQQQQEINWLKASLANANKTMADVQVGFHRANAANLKELASLKKRNMILEEELVKKNTMPQESTVGGQPVDAATYLAVLAESKRLKYALDAEKKKIKALERELGAANDAIALVERVDIGVGTVCDIDGVLDTEGPVKTCDKMVEAMVSSVETCEIGVDTYDGGWEMVIAGQHFGDAENKPHGQVVDDSTFIELKTTTNIINNKPSFSMVKFLKSYSDINYRFPAAIKTSIGFHVATLNKPVFRILQLVAIPNFVITTSNAQNLLSLVSMLPGLVSSSVQVATPPTLTSVRPATPLVVVTSSIATTTATTTGTINTTKSNDREPAILDASTCLSLVPFKATVPAQVVIGSNQHLVLRSSRTLAKWISAVHNLNVLVTIGSRKVYIIIPSSFVYSIICAILHFYGSNLLAGKSRLPPQLQQQLQVIPKASFSNDLSIIKMKYNNNKTSNIPNIIMSNKVDFFNDNFNNWNMPIIVSYLHTNNTNNLDHRPSLSSLPKGKTVEYLQKRIDSTSSQQMTHTCNYTTTNRSLFAHHTDITQRQHLSHRNIDSITLRVLDILLKPSTSVIISTIANYACVDAIARQQLVLMSRKTRAPLRVQVSSPLEISKMLQMNKLSPTTFLDRTAHQHNNSDGSHKLRTATSINTNLSVIETSITSSKASIKKTNTCTILQDTNKVNDIDQVKPATTTNTNTVNINHNEINDANAANPTRTSKKPNKAAIWVKNAFKKAKTCVMAFTLLFAEVVSGELKAKKGRKMKRSL